MSKLAEFREKNPAYKDVPDDKLAPALHKKFYSSIPQDEFFKQVGFTPVEEPGLIERGINAVKDFASGQSNAPVDVRAHPGERAPQAAQAPKIDSVMADYQGEQSAQPTPANAQMRAFVKQQYDAYPDKREGMLSRQDWLGDIARQVDAEYKSLDAKNAPTLQTVDQRREAKVQRNIAQGMGADTAAMTATSQMVGGEQKVGAIKESDFDFELKQKYEGANPAIRGAVKGYEGYKQGVLGVLQAGSDFFGAEFASGQFKQGAREAAGNVAAIGEGEAGARLFEGAVASITQQLPLLLGGAVAGGQALVLGGMAAQSFGQEYSEGRQAGLEGGEAAARASLFAAFEVIGERFGLSNQLLGIKQLMRGAPTKEVIEQLGKALAKEVPGEILTTTGQFVTDKAPTIGLNPEAGWSEYLQQMADTIGQTLIQGGLMMGGGAAVSRSAQALQRPDQDLTAGLQFDPRVNDAIARQALNPANAQETANVAPPLDAASYQGPGADPAGSAGLARDGGVGGAGTGDAAGAPARSGEPGMAMGEAERQQVAGVVEQTIAQKEAAAAETGDPIELLVTQAEGAALRRAVTPQPTNGIDIDQDALLADVEAMFTDGGNLMVQGENAREAVKRIDPKALASALPRGDGSLLVPKRFAGPVMDALEGAKQRVSVAFGGDGMMQAPDVAQFRATVPTQEEVQDVPKAEQESPQAAEARGQKGAAAEQQSSAEWAKEPGGFDPAAFDKARNDTIEASRNAGNLHLDQLPNYVEEMRGREIYDAHNPSARGIIDTVDNNGTVYVIRGNGEREYLTPSDFKDYVVAPTEKVDAKTLRALRKKADDKQSAEKEAAAAQERERVEAEYAAMVEESRRLRPVLDRAMTGTAAEQEIAQAFIDGQIDAEEFLAEMGAQGAAAGQQVAPAGVTDAADNEVVRALRHSKEFIARFKNSPAELKKQQRFTAAAEKKFGISKIAGYRGGLTVHVADRSDGNATVYMQGPSGAFLEAGTIPLEQTAVYGPQPTQTPKAPEQSRPAPAQTQAADKPKRQPPARKPDPVTVDRAQRNAEDLRAMAQDAGWAEEGGRLIRDAEGKASRTKWIPRAEWFLSGMEARPDVLAQHIEAAARGEWIPVKSARTIEGMVEWLDAQRGQTTLDEDASMYDFEASFGDVLDVPDAREVAEFFDDAFGDFAEQSEADAMRAMGFTEEEIANAGGQTQAGAGSAEAADARGTAATGERAGETGAAQEKASQGQQELDPLDFTPKQYHEAKLKWVAQEYGLPMSEVREMQDSEADRKASEQQWVNAVKQAFRDGRELTAKTLDKLEEVRPGAFNSFLHDHPAANVPQGYQTPEARQIEKQRAQERKDDRKAAKEERAKPMLQSNGKPFPSEKLAAESARQRKLDMVPVEVDGGWGLVAGLPEQGVTYREGKGRAAGQWIATLEDGTEGNAKPSKEEALEDARRLARTKHANSQRKTEQADALERAISKASLGGKLSDADLVAAGLTPNRDGNMDWLAFSQVVRQELGLTPRQLKPMVRGAIFDIQTPTGGQAERVDPRKALVEIAKSRASAEPLALETYTPAEIAQREAEQTADDTRAQADRERDATPFTLDMQSQAKPQGVQGGMFTFDGRVSEEAGQGGLKFSRGPRMLAIHNLSADNLVFADRVGGLAVPSVGVITSESGGVDGFGEITLIGTRNLVDPKRERVFSSDAYTARFPKPEWPKAKSKDALALIETIRPVAKEFGEKSLVDEVYDNMVNSPDANKVIELWIDSPATIAIFLREKGIKVDPVMRSVSSLTPVPVARLAELKPLYDALDMNLGGDVMDSPQWAALAKAYGDIVRESYLEKGRPDALIEKLARFDYRALQNLERDFKDAGKPEVDTWKTRDEMRQMADEYALEFKQWVESKVLPSFGEPFIKVRGKKAAYTLDNIVEAMTDTKVKGKETTMVYGAGQVRAAASVEFSDLEQMREHAAQQIKNPDEYEAARAETEKQLEAFRGALVEYTTLTNWRGEPDTWEALDASMRAIAKWATGKKRDAASMRAALKKENFDTAKIPDGVIRQAMDAANALMDAPVPYFEAKPQRAVNLSEFAGAVIPKNAPQAVRDILDKHGIDVREYDGDERAIVARQFAAELNQQGRETQFSFAGQNARTADTMALDTAQRRIEAGEDAETVRQETGWFRGAGDGKWRFEINDADAKLRTEPSDLDTYADIFDEAASRSNGVPLGKALDHPALFAAYPGLQTLRMRVNENAKADGTYFAADNTIEIRDPYSYAGGLDTALSVLLHEIQHGIQNIEGFASGGSERGMIDAYLKDKARLEDLKQKLQREENKASDEARYASDELRAASIAWADTQGEWYQSAPIEEKVSDYILSQDRLYAEWYKEHAQLAYGKGKLDPHQRYRRLAGEVEARNTQARQRMSDAERRATPPSATADVADADVIVVFNGTEMQNAPAPANAPVRFTRESLVQSISDRFPSLTRAVQSALRRGDEGKAGGVVVVERAEDLAGTFASKTGRTMDDAVQLLGSDENGQPQGFHDPKSSLTFLVAPSLTAETAPAVLLHEATHAKQRDGIDQRAQTLIDSRDKAVKPVRDFLNTVAVRMEAAGETGNASEASAYIVEEAVLAGRKAGFSAVDGKLMNWVDMKFGKRVGDIVRDFVAMVRAWMLRSGVMLNPSIDDLVALAKLNLRDMGRGNVGGKNGINFSRTFGRGPAPAAQAGQAAQNAGFQLPAWKKTDTAQERIQDRYNRLRDAVKAVADQGGVVTDLNNFDWGEDRFHGVASNRIEQLGEKVKGILEGVKASDVSLDEVVLYAYAEHAPERNAAMQAINSNVRTGSGMSDAEAKAIIDKAKQEGTDAKLARLADSIRQVARDTLQFQLDSGLITQAEFDAYNAKYQKWVPLRGFETLDEDGRTFRGTGKGFNIRGSENLRALGRDSKAGQIFENIMLDAERSIVRGTKNTEVNHRFLQFIIDNPDPNLWEIDAQKTKQGFKNGKVTLESLVDKGDGTIGVKVKGHVVYLKIHDQKLFEQMANHWNDVEFGAIPYIGAFNRYLSKSYTAWSPEFALYTNPMRDLQAALFSITGREGIGMTGLFAKNYPRAVLAAYRGEAMPNIPGVKVAKDPLYEEYKAMGGKTGFWNLNTLESKVKEIETLVKEMEALTVKNSWRVPVKAAKALERLITGHAGALENATRLAAYMAMREAGRSKAEASRFAKNLNVNFNRRGTWTSGLGSIFLFFNPAVQGVHNMYETLVHSKHKGQAWALIGAGMGGMAALAVLNAMAGDDDDGIPYWDKIPQYEKERNIIIVLPPFAKNIGQPIPDSTGRYFKIPMPYQWNVPMYASTLAVDVYRNSENAAHGINPGSAAARLAVSGATSFMPVTGLPPTVAPIYQHTANKSGFGDGPLYPETPWNKHKPDSEKYGASMHDTGWQKWASFVNAATGGNQFEEGLVSMPPSVWRNYVRAYLGGPMSFLSGTYDSIAEEDITKAPFLRKAYGEIGFRQDQSKFYEVADQSLPAYKAYMDAAKESPEVAKEMMKSREAMIMVGSFTQAYMDNLGATYQQDKATKDSKRMTEAEKRMQLKMTEKLRSDIQEHYLKQWRETVEKASK